MVYGDTQTSGKRERLIYAHIDRALAHKHIQFALDHQNDSLEQLAAYLRRCADEIGYLPRKCEIIGGEYLDMRFGGWETALDQCCPDGKKARMLRSALRSGRSCRTSTRNRRAS